MTITYSECGSVNFLIQHAMRMRCIVLSPWPVWLYSIFPHSHKRHDFLKKQLIIKCEFSFCLHLLRRTFFNLKIIQRYIIVNALRSLLKYSPFLSDLNECWFFSTDFRKILKYQILRKFIEWDPKCSIRMDRKTDG